MAKHPNDLSDVPFEDLTDDQLVTVFNRLLRSYRDWVENKFELENTWVEEIEYLSFHRGELHTIVTLLKAKELDADLDELKEIDKLWQQWISKKTSPGFSLEHSRDGIPKDHWWEWVDQLSKLSAEERSTL
jgi:hypothetical protein